MAEGRRKTTFDGVREFLKKNARRPNLYLVSRNRRYNPRSASSVPKGQRFGTRKEKYRDLRVAFGLAAG